MKFIPSDTEYFSIEIIDVKGDSVVCKYKHNPDSVTFTLSKLDVINYFSSDIKVGNVLPPLYYVDMEFITDKCCKVIKPFGGPSTMTIKQFNSYYKKVVD